LETSPFLKAGPNGDAAAVYDRAWATALVEETESHLERDYTSRGRGDLFRRLQPLLAWNAAPEGAAAEIADACGLTAGAVRVALKRLRQAWRARLEICVAQTVGDESEVQDEVRYLLKALAA
jgi:hypothetical protein